LTHIKLFAIIEHNEGNCSMIYVRSPKNDGLRSEGDQGYFLTRTWYESECVKKRFSY